MAGPAALGVVRAITTKAGRTLYQNARGKFISKAAYDLANRRGPGGRLLSKAAAARRGTQQKREQRLRNRLGDPRAGTTWIELADKYEERFEGY